MWIALRLAIRRGVLLGLVIASLVGVLPQTAQASPLSFVNIGGRHYLTGNVEALANRLVKTTDIRFVLAAVERCRGIQVRGFVSTGGVGLTAYLPASLSGCVETPNGGPGGGVGGPCLQGFATPRIPDPTGVAHLPATPLRYYVMFAGTGSTVCEDISTQVPGGVWAQTTTPISGLPAGSVALVKCQASTSNGLLDYLAQWTSSLPASKMTYWINDYYFATGATQRLTGVPACYGSSF